MRGFTEENDGCVLAPKSYENPPKVCRVRDDKKFEITTIEKDSLEHDDLVRNSAALEGIIRHPIGMYLFVCESKSTCI